MSSAKKRILLLVTQADWGGVQSFLIRFANQLQAEGHTVLLAAGGEGELWQEAKKNGVPCHQFRHVVRDISPLEEFRGIKEINQLIAEFKPDAIHLNSSKMGVLGSIAARAHAMRPYTKPRIVYRIGGWSFLDPQPEWKRWIYRTAEKFTARYKDTIITVHPGDEALAKQLGIRPRKDIRTVPNGLDVLAFCSHLGTRAISRNILGLPEHAFVFGTVANAYATKGLLDYLDVAKKILDDDRGTMCVILGDGPEFEDVQKKRDALGLTDRILLPGHRDDAARLYSAFDAFVLPSKKEGMPWTLLEAMTASLPCIATDVGACRWMLTQGNHGDAGIIVPPNDNSALFTAMKQMKNDRDQRDRFSRSGRLSSEERFSWKQTYQGNLDALT